MVSMAMGIQLIGSDLDKFLCEARNVLACKHDRVTVINLLGLLTETFKRIFGKRKSGILRGDMSQAISHLLNPIVEYLCSISGVLGGGRRSMVAKCLHDGLRLCFDEAIDSAIDSLELRILQSVEPAWSLLHDSFCRLQSMESEPDDIEPDLPIVPFMKRIFLNAMHSSAADSPAAVSFFLKTLILKFEVQTAAQKSSLDNLVNDCFIDGDESPFPTGMVIDQKAAFIDAKFKDVEHWLKNSWLKVADDFGFRCDRKGAQTDFRVYQTEIPSDWETCHFKKASPFLKKKRGRLSKIARQKLDSIVVELAGINPLLKKSYLKHFTRLKRLIPKAAKFNKPVHTRALRILRTFASFTLDDLWLIASDKYHTDFSSYDLNLLRMLIKSSEYEQNDEILMLISNRIADNTANQRLSPISERELYFSYCGDEASFYKLVSEAAIRTLTESEYNRVTLGLKSILTHKYPIRCSTLGTLPLDILVRSDRDKPGLQHLDDKIFVFNILGRKNKKLFTRAIPSRFYYVLAFYAHKIRRSGKSNMLFTDFEGNGFEDKCIATIMANGWKRYFGDKPPHNFYSPVTMQRRFFNTIIKNAKISTMFLGKAQEQTDRVAVNNYFKEHIGSAKLFLASYYQSALDEMKRIGIFRLRWLEENMDAIYSVLGPGWYELLTA